MTASRTALVTGGNRGIGLEICRQLAVLGHRVILSARNLANAEAAATRLDAGTIEPAQLDVTDTGSIRALAAKLSAGAQHVDVLVNNAAVLLDEGGPIVGLTGSDL